MLREAFQYLSTPCEPYARRLGYLGEIIGIGGRYSRHQVLWDEHLQHTRGVIRDAVSQCQRHRKAVVLGSGMLLDIPLEFLSDTFEKVVLVDVLHLRGSRRQWHHLNNLEFVCDDISGVARALHDAIPTSQEQLPIPQSCADLIDHDTDLLISANLLSQLPVVPCDYLQRHAGFDPALLHDWSQTIIHHHLELLANARCTTCLVTDIRHDYLDRAGKVLHQEDMLCGLQLPQSGHCWQWPLAPFGEQSNDYQVTATVCGLVMR
ncbi:MAG: hypothetical protein BMS9Abin26_1518 [Gammaproteobacteria bacterium]|nr:MAG: hypothetical protein BMS9Abin26_1518 [Gammaproteobacteria bacterium]